MNDVVYVVEEYFHYEGSNILGVYTDRVLATEKILEHLKKKNGIFKKIPSTDEWTDGGTSYIINEIALNQDI